jgi:hypothetical protein
MGHQSRGLACGAIRLAASRPNCVACERCDCPCAACACANRAGAGCAAPNRCVRGRLGAWRQIEPAGRNTWHLRTESLSPKALASRYGQPLPKFDPTAKAGWWSAEKGDLPARGNIDSRRSLALRHPWVPDLPSRSLPTQGGEGGQGAVGIISAQGHPSPERLSARRGAAPITPIATLAARSILAIPTCPRDEGQSRSQRLSESHAATTAWQASPTTSENHPLSRRPRVFSEFRPQSLRFVQESGR